MKLVILITAQVEDGLDIAQAWQEAGAPGVTIVRSHGLHTLQRELRSGSVELPRMIASMGAAMAAILDNVEERGELILSLVEDDLVDALIAAANDVLGDLTQPNHGILFVVPIERAIGVRRHDGS
jgi:nitrogen regulatory protein PII